MELYAPCRDSIDHLMSECGMLVNHSLQCDATDRDFYASIDECQVGLDRFNNAMLEQFTVQSFDFKKQFTSYTRYMSERLQPRRIESAPYVKRETNIPRNRSNECIWKDEELMAKAQKHLVEKNDYYAFCNQCIGTSNEITRDMSEESSS
ncbi:hypothetical protein ACHAWF_007823 [Thalassiosira exigua]